MKVYIKELAVHMELGTKGITFDVYDTDGTTFLGDLRIGKGTLEWCNGKAQSGPTKNLERAN